MTIKPMTEHDARVWYQEHFDGDIPSGLEWYWIEKAQMFPDRPNVWLISSDDGLRGIYAARTDARIAAGRALGAVGEVGR